MSHNSSHSNELPPWLRGVPLPPDPSDANAPSEDLDDSAATQLGSFGMRDDTPPAATAHPHDEQPADDVPDWLSGAAEPATTDEVPDWLRDLGADEPAPQSDMRDSIEASAPASQDEASVPDWLLDLGGATSAPTDAPVASDTSDTPAGTQPDTHDDDSDDGVPDWLRADLAADLRPSAGDSADEDTPDWLHDLGAATPARATPDEQPADAEEAPGWSPPPNEADESAPEDAVPAWLLAEAAMSTPQDAADADVAAPHDTVDAPDDDMAEVQPPFIPPPSTASAAPADDDAGVPSWLNAAPLNEVREIMSREDEIDSDIAPFTFEGQNEARSSTPADAPAWLGAASENAESSEAPSWLDALTTAQPAADEQDDTPADAPPWLHGGADAGSADFLTLGAADDQNSGPGWLNDATTTDTSAETSGDMPSWMHADRETPEPSGDTPAWLQDAETTEPSDDTPNWLGDSKATDAPAETSGDMPSWMHADRETSEPSGDTPSWVQDAETTEPSGGTPDWLSDSQTTDTPAPPSGDTPSWVQDAETTEPSGDTPSWVQDAETTDTPAPPSGDAPSWLQDSETTEPSGDAPSWLQDAETTEPSDDAPGWLSDSQATDAPSSDAPPWMHDDSGTPLPPTMPGDANLPAWLQDETPAGGPPAAPAAPEWAEPAPVSDASSWFDDIGTDQIDAPAASDESESEFLGGSELPTWLRPAAAQREQPSEADQRDARALDWLSRLGGVEEEPAVAMPEDTGPRLAPPAAPVRSQEHLNAVALLERLAARPMPEAAALPHAAPASRWQRGGAERLLYVGLLVILLAALLVPALAGSLQVPPVAASAQPLFAQLDTLTENDVVLVGYEWNARRVSELRPLEQAVMGHLLAKKVKLVIVSTDPQGTLVAFDLRQSLADAGYEPRGLDYIWLGYKPGGEVALRSLAQDLPGALRSDFYGDDANISPLARGFRTDTPLTSLESFASIIVLADEPLDVQGWMEQIHRSVPQTPIAFLLPSETAPITQPYMRQPNVLYLAGRAGALAYENLRGTSAADQGVQLQYGQQRLGLLVFAALLLIGIVGGAATAAARRGKDGA